jgi:hypothetical protein
MQEWLFLLWWRASWGSLMILRTKSHSLCTFFPQVWVGLATCFWWIEYGQLMECDLLLRLSYQRVWFPSWLLSLALSWITHARGSKLPHETALKLAREGGQPTTEVTLEVEPSLNYASRWDWTPAAWLQPPERSRASRLSEASWQIPSPHIAKYWGNLLY